jgi:hypothetical protein
MRSRRVAAALLAAGAVLWGIRFAIVAVHGDDDVAGAGSTYLFGALFLLLGGGTATWALTAGRPIGDRAPAFVGGTVAVIAVYLALWGLGTVTLGTVGPDWLDSEVGVPLSALAALAAAALLLRSSRRRSA